MTTAKTPSMIPTYLLMAAIVAVCLLAGAFVGGGH